MKKLLATLGTYLGIPASLILTIVFTVVPGAPTEMLIPILITGLAGATGFVSLKAIEAKQIERKILEQIAYSNGKVTGAELVLKLKQPSKKVKKALDELQSDGIVGSEVTDSGQLLYSLTGGLGSLEDKMLDRRF